MITRKRLFFDFVASRLRQLTAINHSEMVWKPLVTQLPRFRCYGRFPLRIQGETSVLVRDIVVLLREKKGIERPSGQKEPVEKCKNAANAFRSRMIMEPNTTKDTMGCKDAARNSGWVWGGFWGTGSSVTAKQETKTALTPIYVRMWIKTFQLVELTGPISGNKQLHLTGQATKDFTEMAQEQSITRWRDFRNPPV